MAHKTIAIGAAAALAGAVVLRRLGVEPVPTVFYLLAWYPTLLLVNALVAAKGGPSLWDQPRDTAAMLWWSVVIWCGFEALNFRLRDWYYVFVPASPWQRWLGISASFATVVPAILLPERLLDRLGIAHRLVTRPVPLAPRDLRLAVVLGAALLAGALVLPAVLHPLTWGALWLVAEPALYRVDRGHSLFGDIGRGQWGRIVRMMLGGLFAGVLWEAYNVGSRGKWIYTVPFLEHMKIFEMPPIGFLGFTFFALEVWSLYHLLAPRTRPRTVLPSVAVAALVLAGIDHWTVSSVTPRLGDLPGISDEVRGRLQDAGWPDVFRLARTPTAELAYRARITPEAAQVARQAARLSTLRGIGTRHAAALIAGGIATVEALAQADPDSVWRVAHHSARPTPAEVRVWICAAQRAAGGPVKHTSDPP